MAYKGRLSWIQYIATKRSRFGIKFYTLCEAQTGYIWNSVLYTGKGTKFDEKYNEYGLATFTPCWAKATASPLTILHVARTV